MGSGFGFAGSFAEALADFGGAFLGTAAAGAADFTGLGGSKRREVNQSCETMLSERRFNLGAHWASGAFSI